jgi:DNA-binding FadR family transcriptional regulator
MKREPNATSAQPAAGRYRPGYEVTAESVLEFIAARGLQPGDRLPTELDLATELGVSRSVLREAVKVLSALGRVRAEKGRGLYVADEPGLLSGADSLHFTFMPANLDHVFMLFEFRRTQEVTVSRLAAGRATPTELGAIKEAAERCLRGTKTGSDMTQFRNGDEDFHRAVAAASHNPFLASTLVMARRLQSQSAIIGLQGTPGGELRTAAEEHIVIYEAIALGRSDDAAAAAAAHIEHTMDGYRQEIQRRLFG